MLETWVEALNRYRYPVDLGGYRNGSNFSSFFENDIIGDRESTMEFEDRFRTNAANNVAAWLEVVYWKSRRTMGYVTNDYTSNNAERLWGTVEQFVADPTRTNLANIRGGLELKSGLAVALTFPAFTEPDNYPMIDRWVAQWVNEHYIEHNVGRNNELTLFHLQGGRVQDNDFNSYLAWVEWCREMSSILTSRTTWPEDGWRARDVEMAVFSAMKQQPRLQLNVLH